MAINPVPLPTVPRLPTPTVMARDEHSAAVATLFPKALEVLRERLMVANDWGAARLVIEACLPKGRPVAIGADCSPETVEQAMATGAISPAEASTIAAAMKALREVKDLDVLTIRVQNLERALRLASAA